MISLLQEAKVSTRDFEDRDKTTLEERHEDHIP